MADKKAVILLSGGMDSATILAIARGEGFDCYALSFRYGQKHKREIEAAKKLVDFLGAAGHRIIDIDLAAFGGSALTDQAIEIPKDRAELGYPAKIPPTYVPARNTIFLSYALAWAEVLGAFDIFIGVNSTDYSGYPDCRAEFISAFDSSSRIKQIEKKIKGLNEKYNFLDMDNMLFLFAYFVFFTLLITILAIIHNSTDRRRCFCSNFDQIQVMRFCNFQGFFQFFYSDLITIRTNQTNFFGSDLFI